MTESREDIIGAFVDMEPVDAIRLAEALSEPDGRAYLVDLLVLRGITREVGAQSEAVAPQTRERSWRWLTAAAALAAACALGGYGLGSRRMPAITPAPVLPQVAPASRAPVAPAPTRVIRFERGVDWTERAGGS